MRTATIAVIETQPPIQGDNNATAGGGDDMNPMGNLRTPLSISGVVIKQSSIEVASNNEEGASAAALAPLKKLPTEEEEEEEFDGGLTGRQKTALGFIW